MAIYHCSIKIISRGQGRSAVAAAAYRSGTKLHCDREDREYNFSRKNGIVVHGIFLPKNAPKEYKDRETLWNSVEKIEKNSCAQLAREFEVALPAELDVKHQKTVIREFCVYLRDQGMICDASIHDKGDGNPHAHIMTTMRSLLPDGSWAPKSKKVYHLDQDGNKIIKKRDRNGRIQYDCHKEDYNDWNNPKNAEVWRAKWAEICNRYLSKEQQIDHRSYARQGVDQIPTIHEGYAARQMERCGQPADRCQINRDIKAAYAKTREIAGQKAEIDKLLKQLTVLHKQQEKAAAVVAAPTPETKEIDYAQLYTAEKTMIQAAHQRDRASKALDDLLAAPINDLGLQKEVNYWRAAERMMNVKRQYQGIYDEYIGKKFGKKGYYKKHEQEIQSYMQAQQWLGSNGITPFDEATLSIRRKNVERKLQNQLELANKQRNDDVAVAQKAVDQSEVDYQTAQQNFYNLMKEHGINPMNYDDGAGLYGQSLEELVREKAAPSMAAADRPQQPTENPKVSAPEQAVKEAIQDEFAEVMAIDWGKASEEYPTFEAPGLYEDIPVPESFADRLQRAQREAAERNRSREKSSRHHDFER